MDYYPKHIAAPQVPPTLFGPLGRKHMAQGLQARFKVAHGPEFTPSITESKPTKPTARVPGPKGSRQQTSGDYNAPGSIPEHNTEPIKPAPGSRRRTTQLAPPSYGAEATHDPDRDAVARGVEQENAGGAYPEGGQDVDYDPDDFESALADEPIDLEDPDMAKREADRKLHNTIEGGANLQSGVYDWTSAHMQPGRFMGPEEWIDSFQGALPTNAGDKYCKQQAERMKELAQREGINDAELLRIVWDTAFYKARRAWLEYTTGGEAV